MTLEHWPSATARVGLASIGIDANAIDLLIADAALDGGPIRALLEETGCVIAEALGWSMAMSDFASARDDAAREDALGYIAHEIADADQYAGGMEHAIGNQVYTWQERIEGVWPDESSAGNSWVEV